MTNYEAKRRERLAQSLNIDSSEMASYSIKRPRSSKASTIFFIVFAFCAFLFHVLFGVAKIDGQSMDPTLKNNEIRLYSKLQKPRRFDVGVFLERELEGGDSKYIVKRIIGIPGDTVTVVSGQLYVNDQIVIEHYLDEEHIQNFKDQSFTIQVPDDHYFVLGDNRDVSKDSRQVGSFVTRSIRGIII